MLQEVPLLVNVVITIASYVECTSLERIDFGSMDNMVFKDFHTFNLIRTCFAID